ncbi:uncharacterized protein LOC135220144 [Macrobrachium nipponense]|uniref:uncharacterized protein LOC135220144 n=1 Tax=Macrobrachium nipponense TaxID=159736 RepID=UPI0030C8A6E8
MSYIPGYTGHVAGKRADCGRRTSILASHNALRRPPTPTPAMCIRLDDLMALKSYEAHTRDNYHGLPLPVLRSRLDHTPTSTHLLLITTQTHRNILNTYAGSQYEFLY